MIVFDSFGCEVIFFGCEGLCKKIIGTMKMSGYPVYFGIKSGKSGNICLQMECFSKFIYQ